MLKVLVAYTSVGFCVAILQERAMREASESEMATDTDSYAFFHNWKVVERRPITRKSYYELQP